MHIFKPNSDNWFRTDAKPCVKCSEVKTLAQFSTGNGRGFLKRDSYCRPCRRVYHQEKYDSGGEKLKEKYRKYSQSYETRRNVILRTYGEHGLEIDDRRSNGDACDGCGQVYRIDLMQIDHDHETGEVRGLLCMGCNNALGCVKDDLKVLQGLMNYLEDWGK